MKSREKVEALNTSTNFKRKTTGFFYAVSHPASRELVAKMMCDIAADMPIANTFECMSGMGNIRKLHKMARDIARDRRHEALCSIGTLATEILQYEMHAAGNNTPIVMADISSPLIFEPMEPPKKSLKPLTRVSNTANVDMREHIGNLFKLAYDTSRVLVLGNLKTSLHHEIHELKELEVQLEDRRITVDFFNTNPLTFMLSKDWRTWLFTRQLSQRVSKFAPELIVLTRDEITTSKLDLVLAVARAHRIPVFATDMESVRQGAAVGYGFSYEIIGAVCAQTILDIYKGGEAREKIPQIIQVANRPHLWVNHDACQKQNLALNEQKMAWLREKGRFV